jgi:hypothetical protein
MAARETAARLEGELTAMRVVEGELALRARPATSTVAAVPLRRPWKDAIGVDHGQSMPAPQG